MTTYLDLNCIQDLEHYKIVLEPNPELIIELEEMQYEGLRGNSDTLRHKFTKNRNTIVVLIVENLQ